MKASTEQFKRRVRRRGKMRQAECGRRRGLKYSSVAATGNGKTVMLQLFFESTTKTCPPPAAGAIGRIIRTVVNLSSLSLELNGIILAHSRELVTGADLHGNPFNSKKTGTAAYGDRKFRHGWQQSMDKMQRITTAAPAWRTVRSNGRWHGDEQKPPAAFTVSCDFKSSASNRTNSAPSDWLWRSESHSYRQKIHNPPTITSLPVSNKLSPAMRQCRFSKTAANTPK